MKHVEDTSTGANTNFVFTNRFFNIFKLKSHFLKPVFLTGFLFAAFAVFATPVFAATNIPSSTYNINYILTKSNSPYIVNGNIYYRSGSLIIEPGTVIKFASATSTLIIHADVIVNARGTSAEPIYFTSIKDDSVGGDTNSDDNNTSPAPGDLGLRFFRLGGCQQQYEH